MAKHRRPSDDDPSTGEEVVDSPGTAYWSVDDCRWPAVRPALSAEMVDLLAPPIVVGVARVVATSRLTPPADPAAHPEPPAATAVRPAPVGSAAGRLIPAGPAAGRRPAPTPGPTGRHRSGAGPLERNG